jgi:pimeloyl-ACP methyl ester carboxylesterase
VFLSNANNLVANDTNSLTDVFVKDLVTGFVGRVSTNSDNTGIAWCGSAAISGDGLYVVFDAISTELVRDDAYGGYIYRKDLVTWETIRVDTSSSGVAGNYQAYNPSISSDGRYVAFESNADNLVPGDTNDRSDIFVKDLATGQIVRVSAAANGDQANGDSLLPEITPDGRYIVFQSEASNLRAGDTNGATDIYRVTNPLFGVGPIVPPPPPANSAPEVTPLYPQPTYPVGEPIVLGNLFSISDPDGQDDIQRVEIWIDSGEGGLAVDGIAIPEGLNVSVDLASSITFTPTRAGDPVVLRVDVLDSAGNSVSVQVPAAVELPGSFVQELSQLAVFAYDANTSAAEAHGWIPIEVPGYAPGVQSGRPDPALSYTSYAYAYYAVIDGIKTAAIAFRGTDPANDTISEFITQVARWDEYYAFHQPFVRGVLAWAAREGIDQVVVTGHSLGGIIAEEFAANDIGYNALARDAYVVTFGSPGCPEEAQTDRLLQFVHTGDPVPNFDNILINREGTTIEIQRPETVGLVFSEHDKQLYLDSINYLSENYGYFPDGAGTAVLDYWLGNGENVYVAGDVDATQLLLEDLSYANNKILLLPLLDGIGTVVVGTRELFDSIKIDGFSPLDSLEILGARFGQAVVSILPGSVILNLDLDQNGEVDTTISLEGDFHGRLVIEQVGDDTVLHFESLLVGDTMVGTAGDDLIAGSPEVDDIRGGAGADQIVAREGDDRVVGGGGDDVLSGGDGNDTLVGDAGVDEALFSGNRRDYILSRTANGFAVSDQTADRDGTDTLAAIEIIDFADRTVDLTMGDRIQGVSPADLKTLLELYVGFFNRVPEAAGLAYWIEGLKSGVSLASIADQFYSAGVQYGLYSESMTLDTFIREIYENVLGRPPGIPPEQGEIDWWAQQIESGTVTRGTMVLSMLNTVHTYYEGITDPNHPNYPYQFVAAHLNNKAAVADYYAIEQGLSYHDPYLNIEFGIQLASLITPEDTSAAIDLIGVNDFSLTAPLI